MAKLTKRLIDSLKDPDKERILFDEDLPGFGLRCKPSGSRSYLIQYRNRGGRTRRLTLGPCGRLTPQQARAMAVQLLAAVQRGEDPSAQRFADRRSPTLEEFVERYLAEHAEAKKKASSVAADRKLFRFILPSLGKRKMTEITRADVTRLHASLAATPYQAGLPPLPPIRSLAYFLPVIEELRLNPPDPGYLGYLLVRRQQDQISTDSDER